jgi:ComF family protein
MEGSLRVLARILGGGARALIEAALPVACAACDARLTVAADLPLCAACAAEAVEAGPAFCLSCARARRDPVACRRRDHARLRAGFTWNEPLRALVHAFKFGGAVELATPLVDAVLATGGFADLRAPDAIVPAPLHRVRRRERGYDQAEALARAFAGRTGVALVHGLARARATRQQARLGAAERAANLAGAFRVVAPGAISGRRIALVDDVVTTGATAAAASAALLAAGAVAVETWCVAYEPLE